MVANTVARVAAFGDAFSWLDSSAPMVSEAAPTPSAALLELRRPDYALRLAHALRLARTAR